MPIIDTTTTVGTTKSDQKPEYYTLPSFYAGGYCSLKLRQSVSHRSCYVEKTTDFLPEAVDNESV